MAKWIYTCKGGKELRNLIDKSGDWEVSVQVLQQLQKCYQEIIDGYPWEDEWDKDQFQEALDLLDGDDEIIINWMNGGEDIKEYSFDTDMDLVDARLYEFYELCDGYRIWVEA